jgi:hypothetical protein
MVDFVIDFIKHNFLIERRAVLVATPASPDLRFAILNEIFNFFHQSRQTLSRQRPLFSQPLDEFIVHNHLTVPR